MDGAFSRKSIEQVVADSEGERARMAPRFGIVSLTLFGIGTMIGIGIFVLTGQVAARMAGVGVIFSFAIGAGLCGCCALCYAELAAMAPVAGGSAYTFTYLTLGRLPAWLIAWDLVLEYLFGAAALSIAWSGYFQGLTHDLGLDWPAWLGQAPIRLDADRLVASGGVADFPAALLVLACGLLVMRGAGTVARLGGLLVGLKLLVIGLVIAFGLARAHPAYWHPLVGAAEVSGGYSRYGWHGVIAGVGLIFYSYLGFDMIATVGQEAHRPQRTIPIAIVGSLAACTLLYMLTALTLTGLVPFRELDVAAPVHLAISRGGGALAWLSPIVAIGGTVGLSSGVLAALFAQSRLLYALVRDTLLPAAFGAGRKGGRADPAILLSALTAALLSAFVPITLLGEFVSAGTLLAMALVSGSVIYLRLTRPDAARPFRVPFWPLTAGVAMAGCLYFLVVMSATSWLRLLAWLLLGGLIYLARHVSRPHEPVAQVM